MARRKLGIGSKSTSKAGLTEDTMPPPPPRDNDDDSVPPEPGTLLDSIGNPPGAVDEEKVLGRRVAWRSADGTISLCRSRIDPADAGTVIGAILRLVHRGRPNLGVAVANMVYQHCTAIIDEERAE